MVKFTTFLEIIRVPSGVKGYWIRFVHKKTVLPLVDMFRNREIEFGFSLGNMKTMFERILILPSTIII
jgi:hypothetical protein